jgi:hypothetical protein
MPEPALHDVQAWMLAVMTDPVGADSATARGRIDADPEQVVRSTPGFSAAERLEMYRRGYRARLVESMRAHHPALRHALGDELFDEFALDYLAAHPPRSYTLLDLGSGFADHLAATRPEGGEEWPDFVIDLARLERAFLEVYEGPGAERERLLPGDAVRDDAPLAPVPCLRLLHARFPVGAYLLAVRSGGDPPLPAPGSSRLALSRRDYVVTITELDASGHALLSALMDGIPLRGAAVAAGLEADEARRRTRDWTEQGYFLSADPIQEALR